MIRSKPLIQPALVAGSTAMAIVAFLFGTPDAEACGGSPPPQCGVSMGCDVAAGETIVNSSTERIAVDLQASFNLTITGNDPRCPGQKGLVDLNALDITCTDAMDMPAPGMLRPADVCTQGAPMPPAMQANCAQAAPEAVCGCDGEIYTSECELNNAGVQKFSDNEDNVFCKGFDPLDNGPDSRDFLVEFLPGPERSCLIDGDANVTLTSGQSATSVCSEQCISLSEPGANGQVLIDMKLKDDNWIAAAAAGDPMRLTYTLTNNGTSRFTGNLNIDVGNPTGATAAGQLPAPSPDPATVCPAIAAGPPAQPADCSAAMSAPVCGCDGNTYENTCLMGNAGVAQYAADGDDIFCNPQLPAGVFYISKPDEKNDNFAFTTTLDPNADACLQRADNPADTEAMPQSTAVIVEPGETLEVLVIIRSWNECAQCSRNYMSARLAGAFADAALVDICGGSAIVVDTDIPATQDCPDTPVTPDVCATNDPCCDAPEGMCDDDEMVPVCDESVDADCDNLPDDVDPDPNDDDSDDDNIPDDIEIQTGSDPLDSDSDDDNIPDDVEIDNGTDPNNQDSDGDGLNDDIEIQTGSLPLDDDTDNDGIVDGLDDDVFNPDVDGDGILDGVDDDLNTPPGVDSDGDGITDATETLIYGSDPNSTDSDGDGISDGDEVSIHHTHPNLIDTDGDGLSDGAELAAMTNPIIGDSDHDGLSDGDEVHVHGTNPLLGDSDGAGARDGDEVASGYDPTDMSDDAAFLANRLSNASLTIISQDPSKSIKLVKTATILDATLDVRRQFSSIERLTRKVGRIQETLEINPATMPVAGQTFTMSVNFNAKMNDGASPRSLSKLAMGLKAEPGDSERLDFSGAGSVEVDSSPNTVFALAYQGSVWAANPSTGQIERLVISAPTFSAMSETIAVSFSVEAPAFETSTLYFMSDIHGSETSDFETTCNDGMDDDNDGATDCADSDCNCDDGSTEVCGDFLDNDGNNLTDCEDSACADFVSCRVEICGDGADNNNDGAIDCADSMCAGDAACPTMGGGQAPTVEPEPEGCACNSTGDGSLPLGSLALLGLGLVGLRRRQKNSAA
jgi:MYXO-CTERM domain-containing protein